METRGLDIDVYHFCFIEEKKLYRLVIMTFFFFQVVFINKDVLRNVLQLFFQPSNNVWREYQLCAFVYRSQSCLFL